MGVQDIAASIIVGLFGLWVIGVVVGVIYFIRGIRKGGW